MDRDCPQYVFQHYFKILYMVLTAYNVMYWFGRKPLTKNFKNFSLKTSVDVVIQEVKRNRTRLSSKNDNLE